ncbi:Rieske (2Fe-2S) protein [Sphingobacterium sp. N143]|uniref:Rieske (2Fe-2S) protein n=1 Tax=Sphingobacterium sp. N143 TaxID=2746727 RepID=UPI002576D708|nr:Rieske (2Fe-2S) protein [Sphingobacterium sp. N143]MDM1296377.1 Rieske (2Fe-2S) protein [Sphingobacterium sp. N143]
MLRWYKIEQALSLKNKGITEHKFGARVLCVAWFENELYVFSRNCPHAGAPLKNGWCERGKVICPFHRHEFDLITGKGETKHHDFIHTYPVKYEDEAYYVGVERSFWHRLLG